MKEMQELAPSVYPTILTDTEIAAILYPGQAQQTASYSSHLQTQNSM